MGNDDKLQEIYDMEINCTLSWFWDGGVDAVLGDIENGILGRKNFKTVTEACDWLLEEANCYVLANKKAADEDRHGLFKAR